MISIEERLKDFEISTDSLEVMEEIMVLEDEYDIVITAGDVASLHTKEDLIAMIKLKTKLNG